MAIGALILWRRESINTDVGHFPLLAPELQVPERGTHSFHAVAYYCKSLKLLNQVASAQDAVFLALLLLYFEILQGNKKAALVHVNHGLALLLALLTDTDTPRHVAAFAPDPRPPLGAIADIFVQLATQARTVLGGRFGHGSSLPNLEQGLRQRKLTMESFMVMLSKATHSPAAVDVVPAVFHSLDEFEKYWIACRNRKTEMIQIMAEAMRTLATRDAIDESTPSNFHLQLLENTQIQKFCEDWRTTMHALDAAFLPLFNRIIMSDSDRGSPQYLRAIHLRLQFLGYSVFDDPPQYAKIERLLLRTPSFHSYLLVARLALRTAKQQIKHPAQQLSLQRDLAWNLLLVAFFCRDPLARDEAVLMLKDYPGKMAYGRQGRSTSWL
ncbi:hypothetical protein NM208_g11451 [Fusarium decemcellulare]|uniref:Uncharacterized protein n=1 Tax=Fusarium decemcellulare TaxID=57161 RepID=A0ACC1RUE5_9HYPO|nr:hypothetical protein NM208_g11451 [Fusarium decemcellulare]